MEQILNVPVFSEKPEKEKENETLNNENSATQEQTQSTKDNSASLCDIESSPEFQQFKVDEKSKQLIRLFRRSLKRKFNDLNKCKHYQWNEKVLR